MEGVEPLILRSPNQINHPSSSGEESEGVEVVEQPVPPTGGAASPHAPAALQKSY